MIKTVLLTCAGTWGEPGATDAGGGYLPIIAWCSADELKKLD
jgi:hypothetical protein